MVYPRLVKRLQILMDEDLDLELRRLAKRTGKSKSALIREAVRHQVRPLPPIEEDPLWKLVGAASFEPVHPKDLDRVIYEEAD